MWLTPVFVIGFAIYQRAQLSTDLDWGVVVPRVDATPSGL
jgi:hypothetical protein